MNEAFGLFARRAEHLLFLGGKVAEFVFVAGNGLLEFLFALVDVAALVFPIEFVAHNVLQIFVAHHIVLPHKVGGVANHLFGNTDVAGDFHGKRTTGISDLQHEKRLHLRAVVEHRTVDDGGAGFGKMLEVLVVGGDDAASPALHKFLQDGFGHRPTDLRFGAAAEFVDEQKAAGRAAAHHRLHVEEVGGVGGKVVFQTLFVADVDKDVVENPHDGIFACRHGHTALQHVLEQTYRFEADGLTTGIRPRDEEDAAALTEGDVERNHLFAVAFQTLLQERVARLHPVDAGGALELGHNGLKLLGEDGQCAQIVDMGEKLHRTQNRVDVRTDFARQDLEDADDFAPFGRFEFADAVVGIDHRRRFDKDGFARCALIVDDTLDFALQGRCHRNDQTAVAEGGRYVAVNVSVGLRLRDDGAERMADAARGHLDVVADTEEFGRGRILHFSVLVEDGVDAADDLRKAAHPFRHAVEGGIFGVGSPLVEVVGCGIAFGRCDRSRGVVGSVRLFLRRCGAEKLHDAHHRLQRAFQIEQVEFFEVGAFGTDAHERLPHVVEVLFVDLLFGLHEVAELFGLAEGFAHLVKVGGELHVIVYPLRA